MVLAAASPALSQFSGPADGQWTGYYHYDGRAAYATGEGDVVADYQAGGSFELTSGAGSVNGTYAIALTTKLPELGGEAVSVATGTIEGPAVEPRMVFDEVTVSTEAAGVDLTLTFTAAELGYPEYAMVVLSSSCDMFNGSWNQELAPGIEAQGGTASELGGAFVGIRSESFLDSDPAWAESRVNEILEEGDAIVGEVRGGNLAPAGLRDFLAHAEGIIISGTRRTGCDEGAGNSMRFQTLASATVRELLEEMALRIDEVDTRTFYDLLVAGIRTGSFEPGSDLRGFYEAEFETRVGESIASGDTETLTRLLAAARQLGRNDLADMILELL